MQLYGNFPRIGSYAEAESYFKRTPARTDRSYKIGQEGKGKGCTILGYWRENERPLNTGNPYLGYTRMIFAKNGDIRLRYHDTDVVAYRPDGTVVVTPWDSMSTDTFYRRVGPTGTYSHFASSPSNMLMVFAADAPRDQWGRREQGKLYQIRHCATLCPDDGGGWLIDETDTEPFLWPTYHKDREHRLREFRLRDLKAFLIMTLSHLEAQPIRYPNYNLGEVDLLSLVTDPTSWLQIAQTHEWLWEKEHSNPRRGRGRELPHDIASRVDRFMRKLRNKLLLETEIVTMEQRPYLTSHGQATVMNQLIKKYSEGDL